MKRRAFLHAILGLWLAAVLLPAGCGRQATPAPERSRVLLIGLDGAEWNLMRPLMDKGEMPFLQKLADAGVWGELRSLEPLQKSPAIWTTIATGRSPEEHGIRSFVDRQGGKPLTQNIRKVKAVWNILSSIDHRVGVVGWLMSWPAEEVNGFVVSDYIQYQAARNARFENRTYPAGLYAEIEPLNRDWQAMSLKDVDAFLSQPVSTSQDSTVIRAARPIQWMVAADATFTDIALKLGREEKPDFLAVYLRSMDTMGHLYWNYQNPESHPPSATEPALAPWFRDTMRLNYRWIDEQVGRLLELADDNTTVIVCSDHGFVGGGGGGVNDHRVEGVLILGGARVARGEITGATVYDLAPTLLALFGLPKADDMPGKVLWSAFDKSLRPDMFPQPIATYETGKSGEGQSVSSPVDEELMERLKALGYIK